MANLDPQVQVKLIEISRVWAEETANSSGPGPGKRPNSYPTKFDNIYKKLAQTVSEK